jgi:hypothetical protein
LPWWQSLLIFAAVTVAVFIYWNVKAWLNSRKHK